MQRRRIDSPFGPLTAVTDDAGALTQLLFGDHGGQLTGAEHVAEQLQEYFEKKRTRFELELRPDGTEFQQRVWAELMNIPFGQTRSYGQIAAAIGNPNAVRAVGLANGANPIAIVVPCHRVIGSNGTLTGYGGGLEMKARLLDFERGDTLF